MWDAIVEMFKSGNGIWVILVIALLIVAGRLGLIKIKNDKISFGKWSSENERTIMKKQIEYAQNTCKAFEKRIPRFDGYNEYIGKYIAEKAFDEIVTWIAFNHIQDDEDYIGIKQEMIWNVVTSEIIRDELKSKEFRRQVDKSVEQIIKRLVQIRVNNA